MDPAKMDAALEQLTLGDIEDAFRLVDLLARTGSMSPARATEWRWRILARKRLLESAAASGV